MPDDETQQQIEKVNKILTYPPSKSYKELKQILGKPFGNKERMSRGSIDFYTKYIDLLDIKIDNNCGITTKYVGDPDNESQIRDARKANGEKPEKFYHPWLQNLGAQARGASILMDTYNVEEGLKKAAEQKIYNLFRNYKRKLKSLDNNDAETPKKRKELVQNFSYEMAEVLKKTLPEEALKGIKIEKLIDQVRDFGNFDQTHRNVITLINVDNKTIIKSSLKVPPVNDKIKELYNNLDDQTWFNKLKDQEKKLVMRYQKKITSGKYILPTQLRYLPGLKNAYFDVFGVAEVNGDKIELKKENAHFLFQSGTMAYNAGDSKKTDRTALDITEKNINYALKLTQDLTGKNLHIQSLNSWIGGGDWNIVGLMNRAVKSIKKKYSSISYAQAGVNETTPFNSIKDIYDSLSIEKYDQVSWLQCKSGKDRTNAMIDATQTKILSKDENLNCTMDQIKEAMVKSNHAERSAGGPGGSVGADGLKVDGVFGTLNRINIKMFLDSFLSGSVIEHWTNTIALINNTKLKEPKIKLADLMLPAIDEDTKKMQKIIEENPGLRDVIQHFAKTESNTKKSTNNENYLIDGLEKFITNKKGRTDMYSKEKLELQRTTPTTKAQ